MWLRMHNPHIAAYHDDAEAATSLTGQGMLKLPLIPVSLFCTIRFWQHIKLLLVLIAKLKRQHADKLGEDAVR